MPQNGATEHTEETRSSLYDMALGEPTDIIAETFAKIEKATFTGKGEQETVKKLLNGFDQIVKGV